jgi:hypothetical protein
MDQDFWWKIWWNIDTELKEESIWFHKAIFINKSWIKWRVFFAAVIGKTEWEKKGRGGCNLTDDETIDWIESELWQSVRKRSQTERAWGNVNRSINWRKVIVRGTLEKGGGSVKIRKWTKLIVALLFIRGEEFGFMDWLTEQNNSIVRVWSVKRYSERFWGKIMSVGHKIDVKFRRWRWCWEGIHWFEWIKVMMNRSGILRLRLRCGKTYWWFEGMTLLQKIGIV